MADPYGGSLRQICKAIQALNTCRTSTAHAQALPGGGLVVGGEVWFGSFFKGIPPVLTILHCSQKLHDIWVMLLI